MGLRVKIPFSDFSANGMAVESNIPLDSIELYDYLYTTENGQYLKIINSNVPFMSDITNQIWEASFKTMQRKSNCIVMGISSKLRLTTTYTSSNYYVSANWGAGTDQLADSPIAVGDSYTVVFDGNGNVKFNNGTAKATGGTNTSAGGDVCVFCLANSLGDNSFAGAIKLAGIKVKDKTTGAVILNALPAKVNNVACLFDTISGMAFYEANGGTLAVENLL